MAENTIENIEKRKVKADPLLVEKNIHAFHLLEKLIEIELDFVFKGGTALILLLDKPIKFSIDIDISMNPDCQTTLFASTFDSIIKGKSPFTRVKEDEKKIKEYQKTLQILL